MILLVLVLKMYRFTIGHFNSVFHTFTDGGVRMNAVEYFMMRCF